MVLVAEDVTYRMKPVVPFTSASFGTMNRRVSHFFGTRHGPHHGGLIGNRGTVKAAEPDYPVVVSVRQEHGSEILVLDRPLKVGEQFLDGWDAVVTNQPKTLVTVRTADCVPVLIADVSCGSVGAVHAGWRGIADGIVPKTVRKMVERFGGDPTAFHVAIGPAAGPCCYEVDAPVIEQLTPDVPRSSILLKRTGPDAGHVDLKGLIARQATSLGIRHDHVHVVDVCTMCRSDLFFSYRREGRVHGTMVSGITLT